MTLGDWSDPLDPDVETQTIYKQLLQGRDKLRSVEETSLLTSSAWVQFIYWPQEVYVATQENTALLLLLMLLNITTKCLIVTL